ncbi:hypothetical protein BC826DRAFT_720053 [Russula brevipes]|nr:hypothetical protein BC826DRAFT_720053 [Russula brevipes]
MRSPDPTLPSITFVLSQAQPVTGRGSKRRGKRVSQGNSICLRTPRNLPSLRVDRESRRVQVSFCDSREKTVDYRFSNPPRAPSRSSFALPKDIFDADAEIEIVVPSPTESEPPSTAGSTCSTASGRSGIRQRTRAVTAVVQDAYNALRSRLHGTQVVRRDGHHIPFDLCD